MGPFLLLRDGREAVCIGGLSWVLWVSSGAQTLIGYRIQVLVFKEYGIQCWRKAVNR